MKATERHNELNSILARCGYVANPARGAISGNIINPPDMHKLDLLLGEFFKNHGGPKKGKGFKKETVS